MDSTLNEEFLRTFHEEKSNSMMERSKYSRDKIVFNPLHFQSINEARNGPQYLITSIIVTPFVKVQLKT